MSNASSEKQFVQTFLQLLNLSADAPSSNYLSTEDYNQLESLGPSLPQIKTPLPRSSGSDEIGTGSIKLNFKSIKPPYKFTTQLSNVPLSQSIYKIKSDLIKSVPTLKDAGVEVTNLKLMIKGKVIQDSSILGSVPNVVDDLAFMVMVTAPTSAPATRSATPDASKDLDEVVSVPNPDEDKIQLTQRIWDRIHSVLAEELPSKEQAERAYTKLHGSWT